MYTHGTNVSYVCLSVKNTSKTFSNEALKHQIPKGMNIHSFNANKNERCRNWQYCAHALPLFMLRLARQELLEVQFLHSLILFRWRLGNRTPHHSPIETASWWHHVSDGINNACNTVLMVSMRASTHPNYYGLGFKATWIMFKIDFWNDNFIAS